MREEGAQRYGAYHDGDLHRLDAEVAQLLIMLHGNSQDAHILEVAQDWGHKLRVGEDIFTRFDNPMLALDHDMIVAMATLWAQCPPHNRNHASTMTGFTGPMSVIVRYVTHLPVNASLKIALINAHITHVHITTDTQHVVT